MGKIGMVYHIYEDFNYIRGISYPGASHEGVQHSLTNSLTNVSLSSFILGHVTNNHISTTFLN